MQGGMAPNSPCHLEGGMMKLSHSPLETDGLKTVLNKRDFAKYRPRTKERIATISEELFQLNLKRKMFKRKESEMDYRLQDVILEEEYHFRSLELQNIASSGDHHETEAKKMKEDRLFQEMMEIIKKRDQLLLDLDIERLREKEEDGEVIEEYHLLKQVLERHNMVTKKCEMADKRDQDVRHSEDYQNKKISVAVKDTCFPKSNANRNFDVKRRLGKISCSIS